VATVMDRVTVNKGIMQNFDVERLNLKKLNKVEDKEEYQVKISNRIAASQNLDDDVDINRSWKLLERIPNFRQK
jgi:hypothetical protein